ncbi:MAG: hypothetical protein ACT4PL_14830 [Phycisphaerales bacterium]
MRIDASGIYDDAVGGVGELVCGSTAEDFPGVVYDINSLGSGKNIQVFVVGNFEIAGCGSAAVATRNVAIFEDDQWVAADAGLPTDTEYVMNLAVFEGAMCCVAKLPQVSSETCPTIQVYRWEVGIGGGEWVALGQRFMSQSVYAIDIEIVVQDTVEELWLVGPERTSTGACSGGTPFGTLAYMPAGTMTFQPFLPVDRCMTTGVGPSFLGQGWIQQFGDAVYLSGGFFNSEDPNCGAGQFEQFTGPSGTGAFEQFPTGSITCGSPVARALGSNASTGRMRVISICGGYPQLAVTGVEISQTPNICDDLSLPLQALVVLDGEDGFRAVPGRSIEGTARDVVEFGDRLFILGEGIEIDGVGYTAIAALKCADDCWDADFNHDGIVEPGDYDDFITCYFESPGPRTDFNGDGFVEPGDLDDFTTAYFSCSN